MDDSPHPRGTLSSDTAALWFLCLAFTGLHLVAGARYGFHPDELLTYSNARDLEWGYVVYPPVTALLARIELTLFGTSLIGFRFFAAIAGGLVAVLTGLMARAMGGGRQHRRRRLLHRLVHVLYVVRSLVVGRGGLVRRAAP